MPLQEYKEIVGAAAGIANIAQCFSPVFTCYDIYKQKSTKDVDSTPFIGGLGICILMLQFGLLLNDAAMIPVNIFGVTLYVIYFMVYYYYSHQKGKELVRCAKVGAGVSVLIAYAQYDNPERAEFYFGVIVTVLLVVLIAAALFSLGEIIKTKSTASLPFPLIVSGTIVSFLWLLYGVIIENIFVQFQNIVAFSLCTIQLSLFAIYPRTPTTKENKAD